MSRAIDLATRFSRQAAQATILRAAVVSGCALALILARHPLPL